MQEVPILDSDLDIRLALQEIIESQLPLALIFEEGNFIGPLLLQSAKQAILSLDQEIDIHTKKIKNILNIKEEQLSQYQHSQIQTQLNQEFWQRIFSQSQAPMALFKENGMLLEKSLGFNNSFSQLQIENVKLSDLIELSESQELLDQLKTNFEATSPITLKHSFKPWLAYISCFKLDRENVYLSYFWQEENSYSESSTLSYNQDWLTAELNSLIPILSGLTSNLYTIEDDKPEYRLIKELLLKMKEVEQRLKTLRNKTLKKTI